MPRRRGWGPGRLALESFASGPVSRGPAGRAIAAIVDMDLDLDVRDTEKCSRSRSESVLRQYFRIVAGKNRRAVAGKQCSLDSRTAVASLPENNSTAISIRAVRGVCRGSSSFSMVEPHSAAMDGSGGRSLLAEVVTGWACCAVKLGQMGRQAKFGQQLAADCRPRGPQSMRQENCHDLGLGRVSHFGLLMIWGIHSEDMFA